MIRMNLMALVAIMFVFSSASTGVLADCLEQQETITIGFGENEPYVIVSEEGELSGIDVDIANLVFDELGIEVHGVPMKFGQMMKELDAPCDSTSTNKNSLDAGLGAITLNQSDRWDRYSLSLPYEGAGGIGLLVPLRPELSFFEVMSELSTWSNWRSFLYYLIGTFIVGFYFWVRQRHLEDEVIRPGLEGISDGMQLGVEVSSTIGHGFLFPKLWDTRVVAFLWFLIGSTLLNNFWGQISAVHTAERIDLQYEGSLMNMTVATIEDTSSVGSVLSEAGREVIAPDIDQAIILLENGEVDGIAFDIASLQYKAVTEGGGRFGVVPDRITEEMYSIALRKGHPLLEEVNGVIAKLLRPEDGRLQKIRQKYIGQ